MEAANERSQGMTVSGVVIVTRPIEVCEHQTDRIKAMLVTLNLGDCQGQSVLEVVQAMEAASSRSITYAITDHLRGDAAISCADPSKDAMRLGCSTQHGVTDIYRDGWAWQQMNP